MELQHTFTVPAPVDQAWSILLDVEGIAPCFPGGTLTGVDGDTFAGTVKVKLGPVSLQYAGKGRFLERDEAARLVVLEANGSDKRGNGTAGATVRARLEPAGDAETRVVVDTDLKVTGRPAQFGRGMLQDVSGKIIDQFAVCLASRMSAPPSPSPAEAAADTPAEDPAESLSGSPDGTPVGSGPGAGTAAANGTPASTSTGAPAPVAAPPPAAAAPAEAAELDLGAVVLPTLAKRYGPGVVAGLVAVVLVWLLRRRGR